jgi:hypothetical protein
MTHKELLIVPREFHPTKLNSSLSSLKCCHVIKKCICGRLLSANETPTETGLIGRSLNYELSYNVSVAGPSIMSESSRY